MLSAARIFGQASLGLGLVRFGRIRNHVMQILPLTLLSFSEPINRDNCTMLSRSVLSRQSRRAATKQSTQLTGRRGLAAPASGSFQYETGTAAGVKFASRDVPGPTTQLAIVAKAGTRYEPLPGLTIGLQNFAFKVDKSESYSQTSLTTWTEHRTSLHHPYPARVRTARCRPLCKTQP